MTETEEIRAAQAGDAAAASRLFARHWRLVRAWLAGYVRTADEAEDLTQATFLRAWEKLPQLRDPERWLPWLRRVARTVALGRPRLVEVPAEHVRRASESTVAAAARAERDDRVGRALARLKRADRSLLALVYTEDLPLAAAARLLDLPVTTLRRRLAAALDRFRRAWRREGGDDGL